jgi:hypothetical protein
VTCHPVIEKLHISGFDVRQAQLAEYEIGSGLWHQFGIFLSKSKLEHEGIDAAAATLHPLCIRSASK